MNEGGAEADLSFAQNFWSYRELKGEGPYPCRVTSYETESESETR
jgi:hypothetical protein